MQRRTDRKIINPTKKLIVGIILTLILSGLVWLVIMLVSIMATKQFEMYLDNFLTLKKEESVDMYDSIKTTGEEIAMEIDEVVKAYFGHLQTKADLSARASYESISALGDDGIAKVGDGIIAKIEDVLALIFFIVLNFLIFSRENVLQRFHIVSVCYKLSHTIIEILYNNGIPTDSHAKRATRTSSEYNTQNT